MSVRRSGSTLVIALALWVVAACSVGTPPSEPLYSGTLSVVSTPAMKQVISQLATAFQGAHPMISVTLTYEATSTIKVQLTAPTESTPDGYVIEQLQPSTRPTRTAPTAGPVVPVGTTIASSQLVIAVSAKNPKHVSSLEDLGRAGVRTAVCSSDEPCGQAADIMLAQSRTKLSKAQRVTDTQAGLTLLRDGKVDAALVYRSDVRVGADGLATVEVAESGGAKVDFVAGARRGSNQVAAMQAFIAFLQNGGSKQVMESYGFEVGA
jgi:molybdate transport system substrate-binding protein